MAEKLQREVFWQANARRSRGPDGKPRPSLRLLAAVVKAIFAKFSIVSTADKALASAGVGTAAASVGFAIFMFSTDHSHPNFNGVEHLMLFAQPLHGRPSPLVEKDQTTGPAASGVDYSATGVIPRRGRGAAVARDAPKANVPETEPVIRTYVLEQADFGVAIVQGHGSAYRIRPGGYLPGAGRIISIEQRGEKWVVVTTQGVIEPDAP